MRGLIGGAVLVLGTGAVGWWGTTNNSVRMENSITEGAQAVAAESTHGITTSVGGRDITVSGIADSEVERDRILAALDEVPGRRVVRDDITVLPTAQPYAFTSNKTADGQDFAGNTPLAAVPEAIASRAPDAALDLAGGMPDGAWPGVVGQGLDGLAKLKTGTLSVADRAVTLSGVAALPADKEAAEAELAALPEGYSATTEITLEDDGTPMRLAMTKSEGAFGAATGKFPASMDATFPADLTSAEVDTSGVTVAEVEGSLADWPDTAEAGVVALQELRSGTLSIEGPKVTLTGTASRDGREAAAAALAGIGEGYDVTSDISIFDDGAPFSMMVSSDGETARARGKIPFGTDADFVADALGIETTTDFATSEIEGAAWAGTAAAGLAGLAELRSGSLSVTDDAVRLSGVASTRAARSAANAALDGLPEGVDVSSDISLYDDKVPFNMMVTSDGETARARGKLPFQSDAGVVGSILGLEAASDFQVAEIANPEWAGVSQKALGALGALDNGTLSVSDTTVRLRGTGSRADIAAAEAQLAEIGAPFTVDSAFTIADDGAPFSLNLTRDGGAADVSGKLPFGMAAADVAMAGVALSGTPTVADIASDDGEWPGFAQSGLTAAAAMDDAKLSISGKSMSLSGTVPLPADRDALLADLVAPTGYVIDADIATLDDGTPPAYVVRKSDDMLTATGKLPEALEMELDGDAAPGLTGTGDAWAGYSAAGLAGLAALETGTLRVDDQETTLTGVGSRAGVAAAEAAVADLPAGFAATTDLTIADDGAPLALNVTRAGGSGFTSGKLPFGMTAEDVALDGVSLIGDTTVAEITSDDGQWPAFAQLGLDAAAQMDDAKLAILGKEMTISGTVPLPSDRDALLADLVAPTGYTIDPDIKTLDDGTPPVYTVRRDDAGVQTATGKLPAVMDDDTVAGLAGDAAPGLTGTGEAWDSYSAAGLTALGALQTGTLTVDDQETRLVGIGSRAGIANAEAALANLPDGFAATTDLSIADDGTPFNLTLERDGATATTSGKLPFGMAAGDVALDGVTVAGTPTIAEIEDDTWPGFAQSGLTAAAQMDDAMLNITGKSMTLTGSVPLPSDRDAILAGLSAPDGYDISTDITTLDDGTPPVYRVTRDAGGNQDGMGKLPRDLDGDIVAGMSGTAAPGLTGTGGDWDTYSAAGFTGLAALDTGTLTVNDRVTTLTGVGNRAGIATAEAALADLPAGFSATTDLKIADDGTPLSLFITQKDGEGTRMGKLPFGMASAETDMDDVTLTGDPVLAEITSDDGQWPAFAVSGVKALDSMPEGSLSIIDKELTLTGVVPLPSDRAAAIAMLNVPEGYSSTTDIKTLDDGTPPVYTVLYDASGDASVSGKLPVGLDRGDVASALGVPAMTGVPTLGLTGSTQVGRNQVSAVADYLPRLDSARIDANGDDVVYTLVASAGEDFDALKRNLERDLPGTVNVTQAALPDSGTTRINSRTGLTERFTGLSWEPDFDFDANLANCGARTDELLSRTKINYITGSAQLDPQSVRSIDALSGLIAYCLDRNADLTVELGGHTDNVGTDANNQRLSERRAQSVRAALLERGIDAIRLTARGYGESQPIATNDTDEGRAANRRTTLTWGGQ